jgi:O-antigen/teichoic acid export membrane protein
VNQLKAGALLSYTSIFITIIANLLYIPIMLRLLGQSEYGLYSLIGSVVGYLSILDLGLGSAVVRYIARNRALGDKDAESNLNGMFLFLYSFIGLLTVIIGAVLYFNIDNMFAATLKVAELEKAKIMMILLIFNFAVSFPLSVFDSIMQAYERFVFVKLVAIIRLWFSVNGSGKYSIKH